MKDVDLIDADIHRRLVRKYMRYHWTNPITLALVVVATYIIIGAYL